MPMERPRRQPNHPPQPAPPAAVTLTLTRRRLTLIVLGIVVLTAAVGGWLLFRPHGSSAEREVQRYARDIGRLVILPNGEKPALATITDPTKLGHQKFFKDSKPGDKVLIYSEHNVVVLYRPAAHKVVNMGPVDIAPLSSPSPAPAPSGAGN